MGHNLLGVLPRTRTWTSVVDQLQSGADTASVVAGSLRAAERQFLRASDDPVFVEAVRILLNIPLAGRAADFGQALRDVDIPAPNAPELLDLLSAVTARLDDVRGAAQSMSDMGEIAARALVSTMSQSIGDALPSLFAATPGDVQARARQLSWSKGIAELSRQFFAEVMTGSLSYWLDRTLASHVGSDLRFPNAAARDAFDREMRSYTSSMTRIIQEFSGGWYGKTLHEHGGFRTRDAAIFGAVALKKIVSELKRDRAFDA